MIIQGDHRELVDEGICVFTLVSADGASELSIRLADEFSDGFREHLAARGFRVAEGGARSILSEVIVATAAHTAAWTAVGGTVIAFLHRHRGKVHRFEVEGKSITIEGYSAREAERMATTLLELSRESGSGEAPGTPPAGRR